VRHLCEGGLFQESDDAVAQGIPNGKKGAFWVARAGFRLEGAILEGSGALHGEDDVPQGDFFRGFSQGDASAAAAGAHQKAMADQKGDEFPQVSGGDASSFGKGR